MYFLAMLNLVEEKAFRLVSEFIFKNVIADAESDRRLVCIVS